MTLWKKFNDHQHILLFNIIRGLFEKKVLVHLSINKLCCTSTSYACMTVLSSRRKHTSSTHVPASILYYDHRSATIQLFNLPIFVLIEI
jgi:hypothetical protein